MAPRLLALVLALAALLPTTLPAHPVPRKAHDRTIVVRLTRDAVIVHYRLELDESTAQLDLTAVLSKEELAAIQSPRQFNRAFTHAYGPILAQNLVARLDKQELEFTCIKEDYRALDHLRCEYVFRAPWQPRPGERHEFTFREGNYELEAARINVSLTSEFPVFLLDKNEPDKALKERPLTELRPGDEPRLRKVSASFTVMPPLLAVPISEGSRWWDRAAGLVTALGVKPAPDEEHPKPLPTSTPEPAAVKPADEPEAPRREGLFDLLLNTELGFWTLLGLAAAFGAAHALTPGHGKTLVAAYLVGEHGTVWHALLLGLVVTLTHTGAVLLLAVFLYLFGEHVDLGTVAVALGFGGGLMIVALGSWLLLRRLSGGADHIHIGGGHHHHHHDHGHHHHHDHDQADHCHDDHGVAHPRSQPVGVWGLIVLGVGGGIVPCTDAIFMLFFAVSAGKLGLALPLLVAFSAGLASVLVVIGILVVRVKGFASSHWGGGRLIRALPVLSAVAVILLGLGLCYKSLRPEPPTPRGAGSVAARP